MTKPTLKELIDATFAGKTIQYAFLNVPNSVWNDIPNKNHIETVSRIVAYFESYQYRIKPDKKIIRYRNYLVKDDSVGCWYSDCSPQYVYENSPDFKCWVGDTQEYGYEIEYA